MNRKPESLCTVGLIVINIAVFFVLTILGDTEDGYFMLNHGAMYEPLITQQGEYYRLFTSLFLHFGISHLLNNMVLLGALGHYAEKEFGPVRFLIVYLASGLGGNVISLCWNIRQQETAVSAGASGAIFGLMGALLYVVIVNRGHVADLSGKGIAFMVALSLYFGFTGSGVDNAAHVGGLICGFLAAVILYRRKKPDTDKLYGESRFS